MDALETRREEDERKRGFGFEGEGLKGGQRDLYRHG